MQESFFRKNRESGAQSEPPKRLEVDLYLSAGSLKASFEPNSGLYEVTSETGFSSYVLVQEELPELNAVISTEEDLRDFSIFLGTTHQNLFYTQKATRLAISKENKDLTYILDALEEYLEENR